MKKPSFSVQEMVEAAANLTARPVVSINWAQYGAPEFGTSYIAKSKLDEFWGNLMIQSTKRGTLALINRHGICTLFIADYSDKIIEQFYNCDLSLVVFMARLNGGHDPLHIMLGGPQL